MTSISHTIVYIFLFISVYFEVFLFVTYLEKKDDIESTPRIPQPSRFPTVSIIVPCWNEEHTIEKTIDSLLALDYPKDKLSIVVVDDGSTDNTWTTLARYRDNPQISMYRKENGGKHTALNFALEKIHSDLVGCLDADSYVEKDALLHIVPYFDNEKTMAVTPSVKIWKPKTIIQLIQAVEYSWGIFIRKMFSYLDALYVTPGPFSIFRREVFERIGGYAYAHMTEDMEMAMRMQSHGFKIENAHRAIVHTVAPESVYKLYKQRLRWTYGFINNILDYRYMFFNKKYGNLGVFVLPIASLSIISAIYILSVSVVQTSVGLFQTYGRLSAIDWNIHFSPLHFDLFYFNTEVVAILSTFAFLGTVGLLFIARKIAEGKRMPGLDVLYFLTLYAFISPIWMARALYNSLFRVNTKWR